MKLNEKSMPMLVVAAAMRRNGRWLMQQRPPEKMHGGLWEFPGGKVDPGEAPVDALVRELREELAIGVDPADCVPLGFATDTGADGRALVMLLYRVARWQGDPEPLAATHLTWDTPAALARLPMPPVDVPLVATLAEA